MASSPDDDGAADLCMHPLQQSWHHSHDEPAGSDCYGLLYSCAAQGPSAPQMLSSGLARAPAGQQQEAMQWGDDGDGDGGGGAAAAAGAAGWALLGGPAAGQEMPVLAPGGGAEGEQLRPGDPPVFLSTSADLTHACAHCGTRQTPGCWRRGWHIRWGRWPPPLLAAP
jgi:hypothetical protein